MLQMTLEFFSMVGGYLRKVCILECTLCITTHSSSCLVICNILKGHAKKNSCFVAFVSYILKRLTKGVCVWGGFAVVLVFFGCYSLVDVGQPTYYPVIYLDTSNTHLNCCFIDWTSVLS